MIKKSKGFKVSWKLLLMNWFQQKHHPETQMQTGDQQYTKSHFNFDKDIELERSWWSSACHWGASVCLVLRFWAKQGTHPPLTDSRGWDVLMSIIWTYIKKMMKIHEKRIIRFQIYTITLLHPSTDTHKPKIQGKWKILNWKQLNRWITH